MESTQALQTRVEQFLRQSNAELRERVLQLSVEYGQILTAAVPGMSGIRRQAILAHWSNWVVSQVVPLVSQACYTPYPIEDGFAARISCGSTIFGRNLPLSSPLVRSVLRPEFLADIQEDW